MTILPAWFIDLTMLCFIVLAAATLGLMSVALLLLGRLYRTAHAVRAEHVATLEQLLAHLDALAANTAALAARVELQLERRQVPLHETLDQAQRTLQHLRALRHRLVGMLGLEHSGLNV